jgi:hypothetical protein
MVTQGFTATLVAATLEISRSSLYYRKQPRRSRADRQYDEQILVACGEKTAYGYRRVAWWLRRKANLAVNHKRVLRVMRERVADALAASASTQEERVGPRGSSTTESNLAVGHDENLGGSGRGLGIPGVRDRRERYVNRILWKRVVA